MEALECKIAITQEELTSIFNLRYQVYVELLGYNFPMNNERIVKDKMDSNGINFYLEKNEQIVAACRVNIFSFQDVDEAFKQRFGLESILNKTDQFAFVSRLLFHPEHDEFANVNFICSKVNTYILERKIPITLIESYQNILSLYKFMGFKEYHKNTYDPLYEKEMIPMILRNPLI